MIRRKVLQSLTEDEMAMLMYMTNVLRPPGFGIQVNENILTAYKKDVLLLICRYFKKDVLEDHHQVCDNLIAKIEGTYKEVITNDTAETPKSN